MLNAVYLLTAEERDLPAIFLLAAKEGNDPVVATRSILHTLRVVATDTLIICLKQTTNAVKSLTKKKLN